MTWFWLALGSAVGAAAADVIIKRSFSDLPLAQAAVLRVVGLLPISAAILLLMPWPQVRPQFWLAIGLALPGEVAAILLYIRALQRSPLGLGQPFLAFTPLFTLFTGLVILGELPSALGLVGIGLLVAGAYLLNLERAASGWLGPFKAVAAEPGSWMMLAVSAIYAYTAVLGRWAVLSAGPWFMAAVYPPLMLGSLLAGLAVGGRLRLRGMLARPWAAAALAAAMGLMALCHFTAVELTQTANMIAVKRLSLLLAMAYGGLFMGEARLGQHLAAGGLMVGGAALILLGS